MQVPGHYLDARLFQPLVEDRQSFVQGHSRLEQMGKLLSENEQLAVRDLQALSRHLPRRNSNFRWRARGLLTWLRFAIDHLYPDRDAALLLDLSNGDRAIGTIQHALDQTALGITRTIGKLWHWMRD